MLNNKTPSFGANQRGLAQHQDETVLVCLILLNKKGKKIAPTDLKMGHLEGKKERERERDENTLFSLPSFDHLAKLTSRHFQKAAQFVSVCPMPGATAPHPSQGSKRTCARGGPGDG